jgi:hypothetical protein
MKKILTIVVIMIVAIGLLFGTASTATAQGENKKERSADTSISILDYSLKPVGYVQGNSLIKSKWDMELQNTEGTAKPVNIKILFYDRDKNKLKEINKKVYINGNQTKKYSAEVLLDAETAKKVAGTQAFIEQVK